MLWRKKWMNPFKQYRCLACHKRYHPGDCAVVSPLSLPITGKVEVLQEKRINPLLFLFTRTLVTSLEGREATLKQAVRQCPHCEYLLPLNDARSHTIAIVGDSSSGKSHYIASCIYQLKHGHAGQMIGYNTITGLGDTDQRYYNEYYQPIYENQRRILGTQPALRTPPLIYELTFAGRETLNLVFYDSSGEDQRDAIQMVTYSPYILDASAIIFLADPMQMPDIRQTLPAHLRPDPGALQMLRTGEVLNRVMNTFSRANKQDKEGKVKTPIAITVSKSDLLRFAAAFDPQSSLYLYDNTYTNRLDETKFAMVSGQVEKLLKNFGDQQLLALSKKFSETCFFAVTATGWSPDSNGQFPPLEPKRCLDPLLWALWRLGIIDPERS